MFKKLKKMFKGVTSVLGLSSPKVPAPPPPAVPAAPAPMAAATTGANITVGAAASGDRVSGSSGRYQSAGPDPLGGLGLGGLSL